MQFPLSPQISKQAVNLLSGLLVKDPQRRLGYKRGFEEVKEHAFCKNVNWSSIEKKLVQPPLQPSLEESNFEEVPLSELKMPIA